MDYKLQLPSALDYFTTAALLQRKRRRNGDSCPQPLRKRRVIDRDRLSRGPASRSASSAGPGRGAAGGGALAPATHAPRSPPTPFLLRLERARRTFFIPQLRSLNGLLSRACTRCVLWRGKRLGVRAAGGRLRLLGGGPRGGRAPQRGAPLRPGVNRTLHRAALGFRIDQLSI